VIKTKYEELMKRIEDLKIDDNTKYKVENYIRFANSKFRVAKYAAEDLDIESVVNASIDAGRGLGYAELTLNKPEFLERLNLSDFQYQNLKEIVKIWNEKFKKIVG
jgi:hypothetical protein